MLTLESVHAHYGKSHVLQGVDLRVDDGEAVALLGRNGVGKTTTLRTIMGLMPPSDGSVTFDGARLDRTQAHKIPRLGLGYVPQGRRIFPKLSVFENMCIGLDRKPDQRALQGIYERFPVLKERAGQQGGTLSGGEQQMLAIARALMTNPRLLILDEATEGLAPLVCAEIWRVLGGLKAAGQAILVIDKNVESLTRIADRHFIIEKGRVVWSGTSEDLRADPELQFRYLGV